MALDWKSHTLEFCYVNEDINFSNNVKKILGIGG